MSRSNIITNIISVALAAGGTWGNYQGTMRPIDNLLTYGGSIAAFLAHKKDDTVDALERHLSPQDKAAARSIGKIILNQLAARLPGNYEVVQRQNPVPDIALDYVDRGLGNFPSARLTEIQPQDASAAAWEEARRLRQQFQRPQIPRAELEDWQEFNDRGTYDDITQG